MPSKADVERWSEDAARCADEDVPVDHILAQIPDMADMLERMAPFVEYCADGARCPEGYSDAMTLWAEWNGEVDDG